MRAILCGFALGVWGWQQSASLPTSGMLAAWLILAGLNGGMALLLQEKGAALYSGLHCRLSRHFGRYFDGYLNRYLAQLTQLAAKLRLPELSALGFAFLAAFLVGYSFAAWRATLRLAYNLPIELEQQDIPITGVIVGLPTTQGRVTRFVFAVEEKPLQVVSFPQLLQLSWYAQSAVPNVSLPPWQVGERWSLTVRLKRVHGSANEYSTDFEAVMLARNVRATGYIRVQPVPQRIGAASGLAFTVQRWRAELRQRIAEALPDAPHLGVMTALAIGWQSGISAEDWQLFTRTGTNHLVAISGLHISLVAGFAAALVGWLWRQTGWLSKHSLLWFAAPRMAALAGVGAGTAYAMLAGLGVPAQRALIMLVVVFGAGLGAREVGASVRLAWALAIVLLIDPWAVLSAGFWLSFGAVAIILSIAHKHHRMQLEKDLEGVPGADLSKSPQLLFQQKLIHFFVHFAKCLSVWLKARSRKLFQILRAAAHLQGAVTLGLMPLTALWFAQASMVSPLANAFAIPWVSFLVTPLVLAGIVLPAPLDVWAFKAAHLSFVPLAKLLTSIAAPSWALWSLPAPNLLTLALVILGLMIWVAPCRLKWRIAATLLFLPLLLPIRRAIALGEFRLTVLDVGQGAATLVETRHHRLLFDTGPRYDVAADAGRRIVLPYLRSAGIKRLDMLVVSHADSDHEGGSQALASALPIAQIRASLPESHPLWQIAANAYDAVRCQAGQSWSWDGVKFTMLWPDTPQLRGVRNGGSCVLRVENGQHAVLLAGDIEASEERTLIQQHPSLLRATLLLAPHHGSRTSSTEPFLDAVAPREAVFQVGYLNRFHHPHPQVLARYRAHGVRLHRSDRDGAIKFETKNEEFIAERYRETRRRYWMGR